MSHRAVEAVIFDWAGTLVDFGSLAPVAAFAAAFEEAGVPVSVDEIRKPMGLEKRRHLMQMLSDPDISARWRAAHGAAPTDADCDSLYATFDRRILDALARSADPIPGVLDALERLRTEGIKLGSNSGYSSAMMDVLVRAARERGLEMDCVVSSSDVAAGRPAPDMARKCMELMWLDPDSSAVKVDDTPAGIEEGRNAGMWTVAVAVSGNAVGLSLADWSALDAPERARLRLKAYDRLRASNPDYVIDSAADIGGVVEAIETRIAAGERPIPA